MAYIAGKTTRIYLPELGGVKPYLESLRGQKAKAVVEVATRFSGDYRGFPGLGSPFRFNERTGLIEGSNLTWLILVNESLRKVGARTLTFEEGMFLDRKGKLKNEFHRDFGLVVYSPDSPNKDIAGKIEVQARQRGWHLPIIVHPQSLKITEDGTYDLMDNASLVSYGEEVREALDQFDCLNLSGAYRLSRFVGGIWAADCNDLEVSGYRSRIDWIYREGKK